MARQDPTIAAFERNSVPAKDPGLCVNAQHCSVKQQHYAALEFPLVSQEQ